MLGILLENAIYGNVQPLFLKVYGGKQLRRKSGQIWYFYKELNVNENCFIKFKYLYFDILSDISLYTSRQLSRPPIF
jgi:hypothetical protein